MSTANDNKKSQQQTVGSTVSQDIFVKPTMTSETRGESETGVQMRLVTNTVQSSKATFAKKDGE